jgi:hypothetical protein
MANRCLFWTEITELKAVQQIVQNIQDNIQQPTRSEAEPFTNVADDFSLLLSEYRAQYDEYQLDEVVVGAIAQLVSTTSWTARCTAALINAMRSSYSSKTPSAVGTP